MARRRDRRHVPEEWVLPDDRPVPVQKRQLSFSDRFKQLVLWSVLLTFPAWIGVSFYAVSKARQDASAPAPAAVVTSVGLAPARAELARWLASEPAPLPGGQIVAWAGSSVSEPPRDDKGEPLAKWASSVESFTVADAAGNIYTAALQVALDPRGGTRLVAGPSLVPVVPAASDSWVDGLPWPGVNTVAVTDGMTQAVAAWAAAYTSGDPARLRLAVGDTDPARAYVPLTGVVSAEASAVQAGLPDPATPAAVIVRATVAITWPGQPVDNQRAELTFDVLLDRADTAAPAVVAWGGPGTGPSLRRYGNATVETNRSTVLTPTVTEPVSPFPSTSTSSSSPPSKKPPKKN